MKALVIIATLALGGCGAACTSERTNVEGLRAVAEASDEELVESTLDAAEQALEACEEREDGQWLEQIVALLVKVAVSALR